MTIAEIEEKLRDRTPGLLEGKKPCGVLVPLVDWAGDLYVLFEVRSSDLDRQPGEICFPGGRMEPGEDPTACALRETWEELGIPAGQIRPLARLDYTYHQKGFLIFPILGKVEAGAVMELAPNPDEVAETFLAPLEFFRKNPPEIYTYALKPEVGEDFPYERIGFPQGYPWRGGTVNFPVWNYKGYPIWGLSARILKGFLDALEGGVLPSAL